MSSYVCIRHKELADLVQNEIPQACVIASYSEYELADWGLIEPVIVYRKNREPRKTICIVCRDRILRPIPARLITPDIKSDCYAWFEENSINTKEKS